ncbi:carbohydrate porin [Stieleria magnilauensis]
MTRSCEEQVNKWLRIHPDLQYIANPGGNRQEDVGEDLKHHRH